MTDEPLCVKDYLRLKFPDATEEELSTEHLSESHKRDLQQARDIDRECAFCSKGFEKWCTVDTKHARPVVSLEKDFSGKRRIVIRFGGCVKCKLQAGVNPEAEAAFKNRLKASGLTEKQVAHTFETYECGTDELTVAKAQAIQAAKSGRNLILAGKAGTGKTHLATAIAIEAMKQGKKVVFTTLSEMLGVIAQASKDNTDLFGTKMKYQSVPLLVLDDWDKASMTDARLGYLFDVIDYRYNHGLQTIVTTNASGMAGMEFKWYPDKIEPLVSRLLENGDMVTIRQAGNYRLTWHFCTPKRETVQAQPEPAKTPEPAKPVEPKVEPEYEDYEDYEEPDDYDEPDEYEEYSYAERRSDREKGEERSSDGFHSMAEIFGSMVKEPETSEKFTDPQTEEEWAELLDDGGMGEYSQEELNELFFGTAHPEEYLATEPDNVDGGGNVTLTVGVPEPPTEKPCGTFTPSYENDMESDELDETDLRLYGGLYSD